MIGLVGSHSNSEKYCASPISLRAAVSSRSESRPVLDAGKSPALGIVGAVPILVLRGILGVIGAYQLLVLRPPTLRIVLGVIGAQLLFMVRTVFSTISTIPILMLLVIFGVMGATFLLVLRP